MPETENKSKRKGYFSNMTTELKKVIWPSPAQVTFGGVFGNNSKF